MHRPSRTTRSAHSAAATRPLPRAFLKGLGLLLLAGTASAFAQDFSAIHVQPPQVNAERLAELESGEVTVSSNREQDGNRFVVYAVIKTTPERVFALVQDLPATTQWVPDQTEATVLERRGQLVHGRVTTHMPWPFSDRRFELWIENYSSRIGGVDSRINRWQSIHGVGNLDDTHGYWLLQPHPQNPSWTLLKYVVYADVGVALPRFLIRWGANGVMRESIYNMREKLGLPRDD